MVSLPTEAGKDMFNTMYKYVSKKIRKIRFIASDSLLANPIMCVTGSWDDEMNNISLWSTVANDGGFGDSDAQLLASVDVQSDVNALECLGGEVVVAGLASGEVALYAIGEDKRNIEKVHSWQTLHRSAVTDVVGKGETCVSVGEDGGLHLLSLARDTPLRSFSCGEESGALYCVSLTSEQGVAAAGTAGQLSLWDLRAPGPDPHHTFVLPGSSVSTMSIACHPAQQHVLVTGDEAGALAIYDIRADSPLPVVKDAHTSPVWEVKFHPQNPDHLFTCAENGELWHWDGSQTHGAGFLKSNVVSGTSQETTWLLSQSTHKGLEVTNMLPSNSLSVNSMDISGSTLVCGTDAEELQIHRNLRIR